MAGLPADIACPIVSAAGPGRQLPRGDFPDDRAGKPAGTGSAFAAYVRAAADAERRPGQVVEQHAVAVAVTSRPPNSSASMMSFARRSTCAGSASECASTLMACRSGGCRRLLRGLLVGTDDGGGYARPRPGPA